MAFIESVLAVDGAKDYSNFVIFQKRTSTLKFISTVKQRIELKLNHVTNCHLNVAQRCSLQTRKGSHELAGTSLARPAQEPYS